MRTVRSLLILCFLCLVQTAHAEKGPLTIKSSIRLYKNPDQKSICYRYLRPGDRVTVLEEENGWSKVETGFRMGNGRMMSGYIQVLFAAASPSSETKRVSLNQPTFTSPAGLTEISLVENVQGIEAKAVALVEAKKRLEGETAAQKGEIERLQKAVTGKAAEQETTQKDAAACRQKLAELQSSPSAELFGLLDARGENVRLRGLGNVRLIPLHEDYLLVIPVSLAKQAESFFAKIRKTVLTGKGNAYYLCNRRYFTTLPGGEAPHANSDELSY